METERNKSDKAIHALAEAILEHIRISQEHEEFELFEQYTHLLRTKMLMNQKDFCERLVRGYTLLNNALKSTK